MEIKENLKQSIKESSIEKVVIERLTSKEVDRRATIICNGLDRFNSNEDELKKLKHNNVMFNDEGEEIQAGYTKDQLEKRTKLLQKNKKLEQLMDKCLKENNESDYKTLEDGIKSNKF